MAANIFFCIHRGEANCGQNSFYWTKSVRIRGHYSDGCGLPGIFLFHEKNGATKGNSDILALMAILRVGLGPSVYAC